MDPLTPNTSAFLSYLSGATGNTNTDFSSTDQYNPFDSYTTFNANTKQPSSLPPSALFPVPGRDTPETTPPSSSETNPSPDKPSQVEATGNKASDSEEEAPKQSGTANASAKKATHKRKAGQGHHINEDADEDEDDTASDFTTGHDDKRSHQTKATGTKKGGRKSIGGEEGKGGKDPSKAAKRKEQNRAAQKAFRERREAKVKDLEEKLAELEAKSYGTSVENENLRGILKRLQEENVALRQSAFTFAMPVGGPANASGSSTPLAGVASARLPVSKPPTPPHTASEDSLKSVYEINAGPSRKSSGMLNGDSPDSLHSVSSGSGSDANGGFGAVNLFDNTSAAFDAAALGGVGGRPGLGKLDSSSSEHTNSTQDVGSDQVSPATSSGQTELDALWASFLQQGAPAKGVTSPAWNVNNASSFPMYNAQTAVPSFAASGAKMGESSGNFDKFAFRDGSAPQPAQAGSMEVDLGQNATDPWAIGNDNSVDAFLASLADPANNLAPDNDGAVNDEDFNAQIAKILGSSNASPSDAFNLGPNPFSPTNYLNMSPSPIAPISSGPSPLTQSGSSISTSASPESSDGQRDVSRGVSVSSDHGTWQHKQGETVHIVDDAGKVIKPSELWIRMGMQHQSNLEHLIVDDLCDMMRSKATCQDGRAVLHQRDAENMFRFKGGDPDHDQRLKRIEERAGIQAGALTAPRSSKQ